MQTIARNNSLAISNNRLQLRISERKCTRISDVPTVSADIHKLKTNRLKFRQSHYNAIYQSSYVIDIYHLGTPFDTQIKTKIPITTYVLYTCFSYPVKMELLQVFNSNTIPQ